MNKKIYLYLTIFFIYATITVSAQFNGRWYGKTIITETDGGIHVSVANHGYILDIHTNEDNTIKGYACYFYYFDQKPYYIIHTINGKIEPSSNTITIKEDTVVKNQLFFAHYDCPEEHSLKYSNTNNRPSLKGKWKTASLKDCHSGITELSKQKPTAQKQFIIFLNKILDDYNLKNNNTQNNITINKTQSDTSKKIEPVLPPTITKRKSNIIKEINVINPQIKIELYDNGIIDHDTISLYFNKDCIAQKIEVSHQPILLNITAQENKENELIMYAENLGDIPPNTALMIIYVDNRKYEINISSDEKNNGIIHFKLK